MSGSWWAPRSSKLLRRASPAWRVRFPSASADQEKRRSRPTSTGTACSSDWRRGVGFGTVAREGNAPRRMQRPGHGRNLWWRPDVLEGSSPPRRREPAARYCRCGTRLDRDNPDALCASCRRQLQEAKLHPPQMPTEFWFNDQMAMRSQAVISAGLCAPGAAIGLMVRSRSHRSRSPGGSGSPKPSSAASRTAQRSATWTGSSTGLACFTSPRAPVVRPARHAAHHASTNERDASPGAAARWGMDAGVHRATAARA